MGESLISVEQAAKELGVHPQTIRRLIHSGQLRAFKRIGAGNQYSVAAEDVEKLKAPMLVVPDKGPSGEVQLPLELAAPKRAAAKRKRGAK